MSSTRYSGRRFALVDGNNFYVSCERVFQPNLVGKPVIVLSNNDGCAVSRSQEAKALGVKMGQPFFQIPSPIRRQGLVALSSNYALYADLSNRMMRILGDITPAQEVYSIDESFLDLSHLPLEAALQASHEIRQRVLQWIGIPTSVGIGPSKTLAKLANHVVKKQLLRDLDGVFAWEQILNHPNGQSILDAVLHRIPVSEVWGVGRQLTEGLGRMGIQTVLDLKRADRKTLSQRFSVALGRTVDELNGLACQDLEALAPDRQNIMTSRSFAHPVNNIDALASAISSFATLSAEKLRKQGSLAQGVYVFAHIDRFAEGSQQHPGLTIPLSVATDDTLRIVRAALYGLKHLYRAGCNYKKAGVLLTGLERRCVSQMDLFSRFDEHKSQQLMSVLDRVNRQYGSGTLRLANSLGAHAQLAAMRRERKTPNYTTRWDEIPVAR